MVNIFGKNYYIDIDGITERCKTGETIKEEDGSESTEINIFKYEVLKMCLERVLNEYSEVDDEIAVFTETGVSPSFKLAFNTLIKNQILIEEDE